MLFFNKDYGAGGVAQYPVTAQVFLREAQGRGQPADLAGGNPVMGDRTLDYFVAHEIAHQLTEPISDLFASTTCHGGCVRATQTMSARRTRFITRSQASVPLGGS